MWAEALDVMMGRLAGSGIDLSRVAGISGSAQQHGSVYLNAEARSLLSTLDSRRPLASQVERMLSRAVAPVWMDSSTATECREITDAVGGERALSSHTGSRAFERFTGPQIRKFFKHDAAAYAATAYVHLVSSFLASLLIGEHAPVDPGDGSGMNLMALSSRQWWMPAVEATAPGLGSKLPEIVPASRVIGRLAPYWQDVSNSAAMGAALRGLHGVHADDRQPLSWDEVVAGVVCPLSDSITPDTDHHRVYRRLMTAYEDCEARALREQKSLP
jgi:xylulokinase